MTLTQIHDFNNDLMVFINFRIDLFSTSGSVIGYIKSWTHFILYTIYTSNKYKSGFIFWKNNRRS